MNKQLANEGESYKESELGLIPEEWNVVKLGESVEYNLGRTPTRNEKKFWEKGEIPWVSIGDMRGNQIIFNTREKISLKAFQECLRNKISKKGTLLMSFKLTIGRTAFLGIDATHNEAIISIYPREKLDKNFLFYFLPIVNYSKYMDRAIKGNTLNKSKIEKILIPLPPFREQQNIAHVLSTIQEAQKKSEVILRSLKELKKSLMKHLFTCGAVSLEDASKVKLKETEIGQIPSSWDLRSLDEICTRIVDCPHSTPELTNSGYLLIKNLNIKNGKLQLDPVFYTNEEEYLSRTKRCIPENGDVLLSREAPIGEACIAPLNTKFSLGQRTMLIRSNKDCLNPSFLMYSFYSPIIASFLNSVGTGATAQHVNVAVIRKLKIPFPKLTEQQKIAGYLSTVDSAINAEQDRNKALNELFKSMLSNLMSAKIRVNNLEC